MIFAVFDPSPLTVCINCSFLHLLDGGQDWTNPFITIRGDKMAMLFFAKLLWTSVSLCCDRLSWLR